MVPEVVGSLAELKIQRKRRRDTGEDGLEWLARTFDGELGWTSNYTMALGFNSDTQCVLELCLETATAKDLPVLSREQELALA